MLETVNALRGHVSVKIETPFPERFLNVCAHHGLAFWDVERLDGVTLRVKMLQNGYKKLLGYADAFGGKISLERKIGLPFFAMRFRRRYALVIGGLLCAALVYGMSLFIWEFEVVGAENVNPAAILQNLQEIGVELGTYVPSVNVDDIQNKMLLRMDSLAWITVNVKGSRATVEVRERVTAPPVFDENAPCNIIAAKAGVIERMDTLSGSAKVISGQTVDKGQLLVSGIIDSVRLGARFVHADARVQARTWYDLEGILLTTGSGKHYTGRTKTRNVLVIAGRRYPLYPDAKVPFDRYDKMVTGNNLRLPPGVSFPVALITEVYSEYTETELMVDPVVAEAQLRTSLGLRLHELLGVGEIQEVSVEFASEGNILTGRLKAEALEEIAQRADVLTGMAILD